MSSRVPRVITESLERVRLRPGMCFGGTDARELVAHELTAETDLRVTRIEAVSTLQG